MLLVWRLWLMADDALQIDEWTVILNGSKSDDEIVTDYLTGKIDFQTLTKCDNDFSENQKNEAVEIVIESLNHKPIDRIQELLKSKECIEKIVPANIPQFSNFASATIYVPELLVNSDEPYSYQQLGYSLFGDAKSDAAATKYGENHGKMAVLLDLATIEKGDHGKEFKPTVLAYHYCQMEQNEKMDLLTRLCYRIPIIQISALNDDPEKTAEQHMQRVLSYSTFLRRRSNTLEVLAFALEQ